MDPHRFADLLEFAQGRTLQPSFQGAQIGSAGQDPKLLLGQAESLPYSLQCVGKIVAGIESGLLHRHD